MAVNPKFDKEAKKFVQDWLEKYPEDFLWRSFFNIPFGSRQHRETSLIDIILWAKEQELIKEMKERLKNPDEVSNVTFNNGMTEKEVDEAFDEIDLDNIDNQLANGSNGT